MIHSNSAYDAPDAETTAVTTGHSPTDINDSIRGETDGCALTLNSASRSDSTRTDRQAHLTEFGVRSRLSAVNRRTRTRKRVEARRRPDSTLSPQ